MLMAKNDGCCLNATVVLVFNASRDLEEQKEETIPKSNQIPKADNLTLTLALQLTR